MNLIMAMALFLGLIIPLGAIRLVAQLDARIHSPKQTDAKIIVSNLPRYTLLLTLPFWLAPFIFYGGGVLFYGLPLTQQEWGMGMNHGPWGMQQPQEFIMMILFSQLPGLAVITLLGSVALGIQCRKISTTVKGALLSFSQLALAFTQMWFLYWTID